MWRAPYIHEFPFERFWDGYYAYSSRVGRKLCLLISVRVLPLLNSRHENLLAFFVGLVHDKV
jgi:hypothetical protein